MTSAAVRMDRMYRHQRHIYDLTRKYYLLGRDRLIDDLAPPRGGRVLELGCGTGRNLIAAAARYPAAHFTGADVSAAMLATARLATARARLSARIRYIQADATAFEPHEFYDRIFLSYTLSMIPGWRAAIERALAAAGEGGRLHIVDFGQSEELPAWFRRTLFAWLARFGVRPRAELFDILATIAARDGLDLSVTRLWRGYAWAATLSRGV